MGWYTTAATLVAALAVASVLTPLPQEDEIVQKVKASPLLSLAHLGAFSTAFGAAIWVTFIAGVVLFRNLPRHQFGQVQSKLFPAYFRLEAASCSIALAAFAARQHIWSAGPAQQLQAAGLALATAAALVNLLVLEPITSKVMGERHSVERAAGIGGEVGLSKNREVAKTNPELAAVNRRFGMYHGLSSLSNLIGVVSLSAHLYYLCTRLQI